MFTGLGLAQAAPHHCVHVGLQGRQAMEPLALLTMMCHKLQRWHDDMHFNYNNQEMEMSQLELVF